jgi:hypothetical protein
MDIFARFGFLHLLIFILREPFPVTHKHIGMAQKRIIPRKRGSHSG